MQRKGTVMDDQKWLKYGAIVLLGAGFVVLLGLALTRGGDLEGRAWSVESLTIDGASSAPIDGTDLIAIFDTGTVAGTAGCNSYNASYEIDGDSITVGPAASTLKFCDQPAGVMDQEIAYLTLLQSADRFDLDGESLVLFSGDVQVLSFEGA